VPAGHLARGGSPVKEGSYLQRETSASDIDAEVEEAKTEKPSLEEGSEHARQKPVAISK